MREFPIMTTKSLLSHRQRFPAEIISYCVWFFYTFPLSYRDTLENDEDSAVRRFPPLRQLSGVVPGQGDVRVHSGMVR